MIVDYVSDIHIDFYLRYKDCSFDNLKTTKLHEIFANRRGEVLVIAGDIGHYNDQNIFFLKALREYFGYEKVFLVLGNHDYYLLQESIRKHYNNSSFKRIHEIKKMCRELDGVHLLSGDIVEYKDIKFGGSTLWYDGKYIQRLDIKISKEGITELWQRKMLDASMIYGIKRFDSLYLRELERLRKIYDKCDVMITHINPSIDPKHTPAKYTLDKLNGFYSFDGEFYIENSSANYWVFGHIHESIEYEINNTKVMSNPLGYPGENQDFKLKSFKI